MLKMIKCQNSLRNFVIWKTTKSKSRYVDYLYCTNEYMLKRHVEYNDAIVHLKNIYIHSTRIVIFAQIYCLKLREHFFPVKKLQTVFDFSSSY